MMFACDDNEVDKMKRKSVLYLDVAEQLKADILSGKYPVGSLLPTESELEERFSVSKITVRKAIELLATDEYVEKKSGRGTTVLSNRPYNRLSKATTFPQILKEQDQALLQEDLSFEQVTLEESHPAYEFFGNSAMLFRRLYSLDHQPYIYYEYYLPMALADKKVEDFKEDGLYRILDMAHFQIERFEDSFQAVNLSFEQQKFLITPETTALQRTRKAVTLDGKVVEFSQGTYNTALMPYQIHYEA